MNSTLSLCLLLLLGACGLPDSPEGEDPVPKKSESGRIFYKVTKVEAAYGGSALKVMAPTWTDETAHGTCNFTSAGTNANQRPFLGDPVRDTYSKGITVGGTTHCPQVAGASTKSAPCFSDPLKLENAIFQWEITLAGWNDDSVVTFKASPPSGLPFSCNFASVLNNANSPWGLEASATLGHFRAGVPFPVRFLGERSLTFDGNTSKVSWDITVTIAPVR